MIRPGMPTDQEQSKALLRLGTGSMRIEAGEARRFASSGEVAPGNYVYIEVRDTCRGMDMQAQLKMFNPFLFHQIRRPGQCCCPSTRRLWCKYIRTAR